MDICGRSSYRWEGRESYYWRFSDSASTNAYKQYALDAGCDGYATKPVDFPGLLVEISRLTRA